MYQDILNASLRPDQIQKGVTISDDEDFVTLRLGKSELHFNSRVVTIPTIQNSADLMLAGVSIQKVIDKVEKHA